MNLNEECLLQYLQSGSARMDDKAAEPTGGASAFQSDMRRILRRNRFVSFPPAILVRKPERD